MIISSLRRLHKWLIPDDEPMPYAPYVWLLYLSIFFVSLYFYQSIDNYHGHVIVGIILFLVAYFYGYHARGISLLATIAALLAIGTWMSLIAPGGSVFYVYASAFVCRVNNARFAFILLLSIVAFIGVISWLFNFHALFYIPGIIFSLMVGGLNIYQHEMEIKKQQIQLSKQELKTLAATAERERIARDLHDVIGHTFSLLTRKAELANRLLEKDADMAKSHVQEIESISRDALQQVREVVSGYRSSDLISELAHAKYVLQTNDIDFDYQFLVTEIPDAISQEFAIVVKELVTNVLKHSNATLVQAVISETNTGFELQFADNGSKPTQQTEKTSGFGLVGISERISELKGTVSFSENQLSFARAMSIGFSALVKVPNGAKV